MPWFNIKSHLKSQSCLPFLQLPHMQPLVQPGSTFNMPCCFSLHAFALAICSDTPLPSLSYSSFKSLQGAFPDTLIHKANLYICVVSSIEYYHRILLTAGMSRGSAFEYQEDEQAGVAWLRWPVSGRWAGRCREAQLASIRQMSSKVWRGSACEYQADVNMLAFFWGGGVYFKIWFCL